MPFNGSGVFILSATSWNPAVAGTVIDQTDWAAHVAEFNTAFSLCLTRDGQSVTTAVIPFAAGIRVNNTGLAILDTNASHTLSIVPGSDLTANRVLTITTGDAARTLTLLANLTISNAFSYGESSLSITDGSGAALALTVNRAVSRLIGTTQPESASVTYPSTADASAAILTGFTVTPANGGVAVPIWNVTDSVPYIGYRAAGAATMAIRNASTGAAIANSALSAKTIVFSILITT